MKADWNPTGNSTHDNKLFIPVWKKPKVCQLFDRSRTIPSSYFLEDHPGFVVLMKSALHLESSSQKLVKYLGIFAKNILIKLLASQKPTHNRMYLSSKSSHREESFEKEINVRKSRSSHIPKLSLAPPLHGTVPPGPEIWETAESRAVRQPEWHHCFYSCACVSVSLHERCSSKIFPLQQIGVFWWSTNKIKNSTKNTVLEAKNLY